MKTLKRILIGLVVLVVAAVAIAYILPRHVALDRSIVIAAPAETVFPLINNLKEFEKWSPWAKIDPNMKVTYSGPESGAGQKNQWRSDHASVGNGSQEIIASEANKHVKTKLEFDGQGAAEAAFDLAPSGDDTKVTWSFETDLGMNPIGRYFGLMIEGWVGADFEKGLASLKELAETQQ